MKKILIVFYAFLFSVGSYAKTNFNEITGQSENDSIECLKHYSIYVLNLKKKMYDYTVDSWRFMLDHCPDAGTRLYSDGVKLYDHYYKVAKTEERKNEVVDTIMMIYNQRIKYFGNHTKYPEGWIRGRKALDLVKYKRGNVEAMKMAYDDFKLSFELLGNKSEDVVLYNWLKTSSSLFTNGNVEGAQFLDDFLIISQVLESQIAKADEVQKLKRQKVRNECEELLIKSGVGDCATIEPFLNDQFLADSNNSNNTSRIVNLLDNLGCTNSTLYYQVVEKNYVLNPTSDAAHQLAKMFVKKQEFEKAREYYNKAIDNSMLEDQKSELFYELAVLEFAHFKNFQQARDLARNAITIKGDWGKPYMLIGSIYAAESKKYGKDDFEHSTVYWTALDKFNKAKELDEACLEEANKNIALYSKYLPDKETGFFHGLNEGEIYTVGSWINESTKVRFR